MSRPRGIPMPLSSFVGRESELAAVARLLGEARLLTLIGAGGSGKTRLAIRAAGEAGSLARDGRFFVELAAVEDAALVGAAVRNAVGAPVHPGRPELEVAADQLGDSRALLVLDNCEHVVDAAAVAALELLALCPGLRVLATSRAPLGVAGEATWAVPPLSLAAEPTGSEAARLFAERARGARPDFRLTEDNRATVERICRELDGLPLAIELAAARLPMLSLEQIAAGLADRFRLLTRAPRGAPARQQTLLASIDWSHALLRDEERVLLRRLAVFRGGCTLDAVAAVCGEAADRTDALLDLLAALVDNSLLTVEEHAGLARYGMLESIRHYAEERLHAAGESDRLRARHAVFYARLAEEADRSYLALTPAGRERLDRESPNLRAALDQGGDAAVRIAAALVFFWRERGRYQEGIEATGRALSAAESGASVVRARALAGLSLLAGFAGDYAGSRTSADDALAMAEDVKDPLAQATALSRLAIVTAQSDPRRGRKLCERAVAMARDSGHAIALGDALSCQVVVEAVSEDEQALEGVVSETLRIVEPIGHMNAAAWCWWALGRRAWARADPAGMREYARRIAEGASDVQEPVLRSASSSLLAIASAIGGHAEQARDQAHAELERARKSGSTVATGLMAVALAEIELARGDGEAASGWAAPLCAPDALPLAYTVWRGLAILLAVALADGDGAAASGHAMQLDAHAQRIGNRHAWAVARLGLARVALIEHDDEAATAAAHAALSTFAEHSWWLGAIEAVELLGAIAATQADAPRAARLLAAAAAARAQRGLVRVPDDARFWAPIADPLAAHPAWHEGARLTLDDAIAYARRSRGSRDRALKGWASLTPVEAQVAQLAADGLTNPQIGERMFISRGTVKVHLSRVFAKLDVANRAELIAAAARRSRADDGAPSGSP